MQILMPVVPFWKRILTRKCTGCDTTYVIRLRNIARWIKGGRQCPLDSGPCAWREAGISDTTVCGTVPLNVPLPRIPQPQNWKCGTCGEMYSLTGPIDEQAHRKCWAAGDGSLVSSLKKEK